MLLLGLAACSGAVPTVPAAQPNTSTGGAPRGHRIPAAVHVFVPNWPGVSHASREGRAAKRARGLLHQAFISASTQGIEIAQYAPGTRSNPLASYAADIAPGSSNCSSGAGGRSCTLTPSLAAGGPDDIVVTLYDAPPSNGGFGGANLLGAGVETATIVAGEQNNLLITVGGVVQSATLTVPQTMLHAFYPSTQTATVSAFDADGNLIASDAYVDASGNPATIDVSADQNAGSTVVFAPSSLSSPAAAGIAFKYVPAALSKLQQYDGFTSTLTATPSGGGNPGSTTLTVLAPEITEYNLASATGLRFVTPITSGPDSQIWFSGAEGPAPIIGTLSVAPQPLINQFLLPVSVSSWTPSAMTFGSDGALWTASVNVFARTTLAGSISLFNLNPSTVVNDVVSGPDGALWFTDQSGAIGQMTIGPSPTPTEFPIPTPSWGSGAAPADITVGRDGALWFTDNGNNAIGKITTGGQITEFSGAVDPWGIAQGSDGAIWFTERAPNAIGRMTTDGAITTYPIATANSSPTKMIAGLDGAIWFSEPLGDRLGRIETNGTMTSFAAPLLFAQPNGITVGPDGAIWFAECEWGNIDRLQ